VHGLVCSDSIFKSFEWGCVGTDLPGADNEEIGGGLQNTLDIIASCSTIDIPARVCFDLTLNGYNDWFLPSREEVNCIFDLLIDPYNPYNIYSSTESSDSEVYGREWATSNFMYPSISLPKYPYYYCSECCYRAVRQY
jgi:hypothetical protein